MNPITVLRQKNIFRIAITPLIAIAFFSCSNDIEKINALTTELFLPDISGKSVHIQYTDSAKLQLELIAPVVNQYNSEKEPYIEFPEGLEVRFYNNEEKLESQINANRATYYTNDKLWKAEDSVYARNFMTGEELTSDLLYWDEEKELVYSDIFSKIVTPDGTFYGENGFEANQDLTKWRLNSSSGTVNVKNESENQ
jgi:LPS export ABC transporter protein LptC